MDSVANMSVFFVVPPTIVVHSAESEEPQPQSKTEQPPVGKKKKLLAEKQRRDLKIPYSHRWLLTTLKGHSGTLLEFGTNNKFLTSCAEGDPVYWEGSGGQTNNQQFQNNCSKGNNRSSRSSHQNQRNSQHTRRNTVQPILATPWILPLQPYCKLAIEAETLYQHLLAYVLSTDEMRNWGFPVECPDQPGKVEHVSQEPKHLNNNKWDKGADENDPCQRICCRCRSLFTITNEGEYIADERCTYHWGKKRTVENGHLHTFYTCCGQVDGSTGCSTSRYHVSSQSGNSDEAFVKTRPKKLNCKSSYGVYALDCEMCYTLKGLEVTKVTVVSPDGLTIYDSLVLPDNPIVDYNTNYSGISAKDLKNVNTTLKDVRAVLLKLFNSKTIVIGHGLDNDLKALKILHGTVIDTSVVFPHYYGMPFRRSLKSLINCYLNKSIQEGVMGHDSAEDARACMELMLWKVVKDRQLCDKRKSV